MTRWSRLRAPSSGLHQLDQQLLLRHQQLAPLLHANQTLRQQCIRRLEQMQQAGLVKHGAYVFWDSLLSTELTADELLQAMTDPAPLSCKYRRKSPCIWLLQAPGTTELQPTPGISIN